VAVLDVRPLEKLPRVLQRHDRHVLVVPHQGDHLSDGVATLRDGLAVGHRHDQPVHRRPRRLKHRLGGNRGRDPVELQQLEAVPIHRLSHPYADGRQLYPAGPGTPSPPVTSAAAVQAAASGSGGPALGRLRYGSLALTSAKPPQGSQFTEEMLQP